MEIDKQLKFLLLSLGNFSKYEFLTSKDVLSKKRLARKSCCIERSEYSPLGKELKKQTSVSEKQYQKFETPIESNKNEENKTKQQQQ